MSWAPESKEGARAEMPGQGKSALHLLRRDDPQIGVSLHWQDCIGKTGFARLDSQTRFGQRYFGRLGRHYEYADFVTLQISPVLNRIFNLLSIGFCTGVPGWIVDSVRELCGKEHLSKVRALRQ